MNFKSLITLFSFVSCVVSVGREQRQSKIKNRSTHNRKTCIVVPRGNNQDDTPNILAAFDECNYGGTVVFPEDAEFWIGTRMNPRIHDVTIEWRGRWKMSPDLEYWRQNSYPIHFQAITAGIVFSGSNIDIDRHDTGLIDGNGDVWYNDDKGTLKLGRPMPFVFWNVTDVYVRNFKILQPPFWAISIIGGTNIKFENILANATSHDAPPNTVWVGNTDGFDTLYSRNVSLSNFEYRGGDDCVAIKPQSFDISVKNVTCIGGNGVTIGSLGEDKTDCSVQNVVFDTVSITRDLDNLLRSAYIKTWIGIPVTQTKIQAPGELEGGGYGTVSNITFRNFIIRGADKGPTIQTDSGNIYGNVTGTSLLDVKDITFENWAGYLSGDNQMALVNCSKFYPCTGIKIKNVNLLNEIDGVRLDNGTCRYIAPGGVTGVAGPTCTI